MKMCFRCVCSYQHGKEDLPDEGLQDHSEVVVFVILPRVN